MRVHFVTVETVQIKLSTICSLVTHHYHSGERWMLFADGEKGIAYLDELLWRFPPDSFLPHVVADSEVKERIVLSSVRRNLNRAEAALSLCAQPLLEPLGFRVIYELDDQTTPEKRRRSMERMELYRQNGYEVTVGASGG